MEDNPGERKVKEKIKRQKRISSLLEESALPTSKDSSIIKSDDIPIEVAKVKINKQQVKLSHDNKAKLNTAVQALSNGTLPDDFYLHLMSVMGIQECLISNRRVCLLWNELVLERCQNQKSLKLFETFGNLMEYSERLLEFEKTKDTSLILKSIGDDLIFERLETDHEQLVNSLGQENDDAENEESVEEVENEEENDVQQVLTRKKKLEAHKILTSLFPRVEQLVLCHEYDTFINIEHILQFYAKQLTSLTMTRFGSKLRDFSFPMLKSLHAFYCFLSDEEDHLLSLLPQLESLTLQMPWVNPTNNISLETLLRTGIQLHELNIEGIQSVYTATGNQFSKRSPINNNLRKFSFDTSKENVSQVLEFISLNLTSLESLKLNFSRGQDNTHHHLNSLVSYLAPIHQLHSLTLEASASYFLLNNNQLAEIQPLSSVRHLKLLLFGYASLSMDVFSRAIFTAFPKVEQVLIAFVDNNMDTATFAAFEDFAGKHPNVVKLIRSRYMSMFTNLPNYVSPLLGHRRQMYEEYIEFEELFGVPICKLAGSLRKQELGDRLNLKNTLRPANRLTAMSNLLKLLKSGIIGAFNFTYEIADSMIEHMVKCALKYCPSEGELFKVTCQCVLKLLYCDLVDDEDEYYYNMPPSILNRRDMSLSPFFEMIRKLFEHYETLKFNDKYLLFQLSDCLIMILKQEKSTFIRPYEDYDKNDLFKILLKMADYYKARKLCNYDYEELLPKIHELMDDILKKFDKDSLDKVISEFIRSDNRVYRMEMTMALNRCCKSKDNCFK